MYAGGPGRSKVAAVLLSFLIVTSVTVTGIGIVLTTPVTATEHELPTEAWNATYGGELREDIWGMTATTDDGFVLVGLSSSFGDNDGDLWAVKVDSAGTEEWNRTYGGTDAIFGSKTEVGADVVETDDGGYLFAGWTTSFGAGESDGWLVKVNATGHEVWNRTYGDADRDTFNAVSRTSDGGYVVVGTRQRNLGFGNSDSDIWVLKVNATGDVEWTFTDPVDGTDLGRDVTETSDGGFAVLADTGAVDDFYLIRLDSTGNELWANGYGGSRSEDAKSLTTRSDGGFVLAGQTTSFGDTSGDAFLVAVNETGDLDWTAVVGGDQSDMAWDVIPAVDGGFVLGGRTTSFDAEGTDAWIAKVDPTGAKEWNATFGGPSTDNARRLVSTATGFALGGNTWSYSGSSYPDAWLVKLDGATSAQPGPEIEASPATVDFGSVSLNATETRNVTIENVGDSPLNVTAIDLAGEYPGAFELEAESLPGIVGSGDARNASVSFRPALAGARSARLHIASNDSDEPTVEVSLTGMGVEETDTPPSDELVATGFFAPQVDGILYGYTDEVVPTGVVREWEDATNESVLLYAVESEDAISSTLYTKQVRDQVFVGLALDDINPESITEIWLQVDRDDDGTLSPGDVRIVATSGSGDATIAVFENGGWTEQPFDSYDLQVDGRLFDAVSTSEGTVEFELDLATLDAVLESPTTIEDAASIDLLNHGIVVKTTTDTYTLNGSTAYSDEEFVGVSEYASYQHIPAYPLVLLSDDVGIDHVEITQSVQRADNSLPVIRNKETLARVFVTHDNANPTEVEVRLTGWALGPGVTKLGTLTTTHTAPVGALDREQESHSANFELPDAWTDAQGLLVRAEVRRPGFVDEDDSDNDALAFVPLEETVDPAIYYIRMNVGTDASPVLEPTADVSAATATLADAYPVADPQFIELDSDVVGSVQGLSDDERIEELNTAAVGILLVIGLSGGDPAIPVPAQVFGFTPDFAGTSDPAWSSDAPSGASLSSIGSVGKSSHDRLIMAHEINHNIGDGDWGLHSGNGSGNAFENGCGAGADAEWQRLYEHTYVHQVGWDPAVGIIPAKYPDYQSYCQIWEVTVPAWTGGNDPAQWVSEYRWMRMTDRFVNWDSNPIHPDLRTTGSTTTATAEAVAAEAESVPTARIVTGFVYEDGRAELSPSFERPGIVPPELEPSSTVDDPHTLLVVGYADGSERTVPIAMDFDNRHEEAAAATRWPFTVALADDGRIVELTLVDPATDEVLDRVKAGEWALTNVAFDLPAELPREQAAELNVKVAADTDRTLYKRLLYSPDGTVFYPYGPAFTDESTTVRFEQLPGGEAASFLLLVSDGVHTEFAASPPFALAHAPPEVSITRTERWRTFSAPADQTVTASIDDSLGGSASGEPTDRVTTTVQVVEPVDIAVGQLLTLDATGQDEFGNPLPAAAFEWAIQSGIEQPTLVPGGTGPRFEHAFRSPGNYEIVVAVTDPETGLDATDSILVEVTTPPLPDEEAYETFSGATLQQTSSQPNVTVTASPASPYEGDTTTVAVTIEDDDDDRHFVWVDWPDGTRTTRIVTGGSADISKTVGDDGTFTVNVTVFDDGFGVGTNSTTFEVSNVAPTVRLPDSATATTEFPAGEAILARVGTPLSVTASATDAGSDDLTFAWQLDGTSIGTTTVFNDGTGEDPAASPDGTYPFAASDTTRLVFKTPGVHALTVRVSDDDGATASRTIPVLVTGGVDRGRGLGYWAHQVRGNGRVAYDEATIRSLLSVVGSSSGVFPEAVPADTVEEAEAVLDPRGRALRPTAEAHLLAAWLNLAGGGVYWDERVDVDGDGDPDRTVGDSLVAAEAIIANESATNSDLERAKALAEAINSHDE